MKELLSFQTLLKRKATHLFEEYFLASDSGRDKHIYLHFVQLFIIFIKDKKQPQVKAGSKKPAIYPTGENRAVLWVREPHHTPCWLPGPGLLFLSSSARGRLLVLQRTLNGSKAHREHITCQANTLRGWEAFQPGRKC